MPLSAGPISAFPISGEESPSSPFVPAGMLPIHLLLMLPEGEGGLALSPPIHHDLHGKIFMGPRLAGTVRVGPRLSGKVVIGPRLSGTISEHP